MTIEQALWIFALAPLALIAFSLLIYLWSMILIALLGVVLLAVAFLFDVASAGWEWIRRALTKPRGMA